MESLSCGIASWCKDVYDASLFRPINLFSVRLTFHFYIIVRWRKVPPSYIWYLMSDFKLEVTLDLYTVLNDELKLSSFTIRYQAKETLSGCRFIPPNPKVIILKNISYWIFTLYIFVSVSQPWLLSYNVDMLLV